jgi:hypothetical protein
MFAIALVSLAVGCGESGGSTSVGGEPGSEGSPSVASGQVGAGEGSRESSPVAEGKSKTDRATYERARYGPPSSRSAPFGKYSGQGKVKLHLAEFGSEASSSDRAGAEDAIDGYLAAIGSDEWERACAYLSSEIEPQIQQVTEDSEGQSCGETLQAFVQMSRKVSGEGQVYARARIASLRIKESDEAGFALFHGSDGRDHWMAVQKEGGWKLLSTLPQPFS